MGYFRFPKYVSVAERKEKALARIEKLKKKNKNIYPVIVTGKKIANTWWGIEWNANLQRYSDYAHRIERGRSYVRNNAVLDLQINKGLVTAQVYGTRAYKVTIQISPLKKEIWEVFKNNCQGKIDSLQELITGKFPKELKELCIASESGLFPSLREIDLQCTCPDYAKMCKHVAAALYGISVRLDNDPKLFFELRNINIEELISTQIKNKSTELLNKTQITSSRIMEDMDLNNLFGIELVNEKQKPKRKSRKTK